MSTHNYDATSWTQEEINLTPAAIVALLFDESITHSGVSQMKNGTTVTVTIASPSSAPDDFVEQADVETKRGAQEAARAAANAAAAEEAASRATEKTNNALSGLTFAQIESRVEAHDDDLEGVIADIAAASTAMNGAANLTQAKAAGVLICNAVDRLVDRDRLILADLKRVVRRIRANSHLDLNGT